eukprot:TRINITY_DN10083_c0_g1_i1.p1 TRINITY_DN10083_c0_g1~~TRINITY_DN10083_c0_g1_i1.p1  ORF type:complete len:444 (+),score=63.46 TRINITY_DN10083_c0_g1_i1:43-1374(+)
MAQQGAQYGRIGRMPLTKRTEINTVHVSSVLLSLWDNILGPRLEFEWRGKVSLDRDVLDYLATRTLDSDCIRDVEEGPAYESKFTVLAEHDLLALSLIFTATYNSSLSRMALTIAIPQRCLDGYLCCHFVVEDRVRLLAEWLAKKGGDQAAKLTTHIQTIVSNLDDLMSYQLPAPSLSTTWLSAQTEQTQHMSHSFLSRAVTAYLTTGCAVVLGDDVNSVNKMVDTLALFASDSQRKRSRHAGVDTAFVADLHLQGVLAQHFVMHTVFWSTLPVAIIDLRSSWVRRCHKLHEYQLGRTALIQQEMELEDKPPVDVQAEQRLEKEHTEDVREPSPMVEALLIELRQIPEVIRAPAVRNWLRLLERRAVALIECTRTMHAEVLRAQGTRNEMLIAKLRSALRLAYDADWYLVLAAADRLQPGIYRAVEGDVAVVTQRFQMLMEYF